MRGRAAERVAWLREAAEEGRIHTVRVSFGDHNGAWRGKLIPVQHFLERHLDSPMGFCDGMIVCDVRCDIIQETSFSNFDTGYPDLHVWPDLEGMREAAWAPGEAFVFGDPSDHRGDPLEVDPRRVLRRVVGRLDDVAVKGTVRATLNGRFMTDPHSGASWGKGGLSPGEGVGPLAHVLDGLVRSGLPIAAGCAGPAVGQFQITLGPGFPLVIAEAALVTKGACKEVGAAFGARATFMTRTVGDAGPSLLVIDAAIEGLSAETVRPEAVAASLSHVRGVLQPSVTAFKAGPPAEPTAEKTSLGVTVRGLEASSEAEPFAAIAASLAAVQEAASSEPPVASGGQTDLAVAAEALGSASWVTEWLGREYVENSVALLAHEASLFSDVVTDWEIQRYWGAA